MRMDPDLGVTLPQATEPGSRPHASCHLRRSPAQTVSHSLGSSTRVPTSFLDFHPRTGTQHTPLGPRKLP